MNEASLYNGSGLRAQGELLSSHDLNNNLKKLSVIIPAYNVEKFLVKCVESVVNQTYKNIEIIIVDDGSRDNTPKLCDELASKYKNIKAIHQDNQGSNKARETGLNASTGEYIAFIDSDDYIDLNAYAKAIKVLEENNCDMVQFGIYDVELGGEIIGKWQRDNITLNSTHDIYLYFLTSEVASWPLVDKVYKRSLFENIEYLKISMMEDYSISAQLFAKAQKFMAIDEYLYYYVKNSASLCRSDDNNLKVRNRNDRLSAFDFVIDLTQNKFPEFLPEAIALKLGNIEAIFANYFLSDCSDRREVMQQFTEIYKHDYKIMKSELKRQGRELYIQQQVSRKQKIHLWLLIHCQNFYKIYLTTRLKLHALTGI